MIKAFYMDWRRELQDYVLITFGLICYATGYVAFQLPYHITTGGVAGVGAVVYYATAFPVQYTFFLANIVLLLVALKILGWKFMIKTIYAVFMLTFLMGFGQDILLHGTWAKQYIEPALSNMPRFVKNQDFMACVVGAMLEGFGLGIVFLNNGSTGGTDIIAAVVNKYKDFTMGQLMMMLDIIVITSSLFTPVGSMQGLLFGYCTLIISNLMIDFMLDRGRQSVQFLIISRRYDEIAATISDSGRGVTVLNGHGWYTKNAQNVLVVMARRRESTNLFRIIQSIDPDAFVSQSKVIGVFGEGFDRIKVKQRKKANAQAGKSLPAEATVVTEENSREKVFSPSRENKTIPPIGNKSVETP